MCCQVDGCATARQLVRRFPTDYDVSECDRENLNKKGGLGPVGLLNHKKSNDKLGR